MKQMVIAHLQFQKYHGGLYVKKAMDVAIFHDPRGEEVGTCIFHPDNTWQGIDGDTAGTDVISLKKMAKGLNNPAGLLFPGFLDKECARPAPGARYLDGATRDPDQPYF